MTQEQCLVHCGGRCSVHRPPLAAISRILYLPSGIDPEPEIWQYEAARHNYSPCFLSRILAVSAPGTSGIIRGRGWSVFRVPTTPRRNFSFLVLDLSTTSEVKNSQDGSDACSSSPLFLLGFLRVRDAGDEGSRPRANSAVRHCTA
jgi:hypothetical protein